MDEQRLQANACEYVGSVIIYYSPSKKISGIRISMISNASIMVDILPTYRQR
jgi:hypothetical protein